MFIIFTIELRVHLELYSTLFVSCWELGTANQSDRLGDHVTGGRNDLSARSACT